MFEELLKVIPLASSGFQWLIGQKTAKKERFASLCDRICEQLESFANASDDQRQSRNLCAELKVYVPEIEEIAEDKLPENQLEDMASELNRVCEVWNRQHKSLAITSEELYEIHEAAGHFRGLANLIRTM